MSTTKQLKDNVFLFVFNLQYKTGADMRKDKNLPWTCFRSIFNLHKFIFLNFRNFAWFVTKNNF